MVADKIFRHIPTDHPEFEMTAEKRNYLIAMTTGIQNVISSPGRVRFNLALTMKDIYIISNLNALTKFIRSSRSMSLKISSHGTSLK